MDFCFSESNESKIEMHQFWINYDPLRIWILIGLVMVLIDSTFSILLWNPNEDDVLWELSFNSTPNTGYSASGGVSVDLCAIDRLRTESELRVSDWVLEGTVNCNRQHRPKHCIQSYWYWGVVLINGRNKNNKSNQNKCSSLSLFDIKQHHVRQFLKIDQMKCNSKKKGDNE